jgi:hypothetical protein
MYSGKNFLTNSIDINTIIVIIPAENINEIKNNDV